MREDAINELNKLFSGWNWKISSKSLQIRFGTD